MLVVGAKLQEQELILQAYIQKRLVVLLEHYQQQPLK